jgi:hypothetical protein
MLVNVNHTASGDVRNTSAAHITPANFRLIQLLPRELSDNFTSQVFEDVPAKTGTRLTTS